jgi:ATP-dependent Clp protease adapter protein ClpS
MEHSPLGSEKEDIEVKYEIAFPTRVILFNDDIHNFDEVIIQIIKAIDCDEQYATNIAYEANDKGRAAVFEGEIAQCIEVSSILEEIDLFTQIEC